MASDTPPITTDVGSQIAVDEANKRRAKAALRNAIVVSVLVHIILGIGAAALVVAILYKPTPAQFESRKIVKIDPKEREEKMSLAEFEEAASAPSFDDRLQTDRMMDKGLPDLPKLPIEQVMTLEPSQLLSDAITGLTGSGFGAGGGGGGGGGIGTGFGFMGIQTEGRRILIIVDVSLSVVNAARRTGNDFEKIREETKKLLDQLPISANFNFIQHSRNYAPWRPELVPVTDQNREDAKKWLDQWFAVEGSLKPGTPNMVTGGPGFIKILERAFQMQPDVMFIISDGSYQRSFGGSENIPWDEIIDRAKELQATLVKPATIHYIGFSMKNDAKDGARRLTRVGESRGRLREL
jgi:hypothetical protein